MSINDSGNSPSPVADEMEDDSIDTGNQSAEDTSNQVDDADAGKSQQANTDANADSSDADQNKDAKEQPERKLLDVVKDAVKKSAPKPEDSSASKGDKKGTEDKDSQKGEGKDDKPPFHNHPRWKEMVSQNQELAGDAGQFRKIEDFRTKNGLSITEFVDGMKFMALMKRDPVRALEEWNTKYAEPILLASGDKLPADLQAEVDAGAITEETAKRFSLTRQKAERLEADKEEDGRKRQSENLNQLREDIRSSTAAWADQKSKDDPDYRTKHAMIMDRVSAIVTQRKRGFTSKEDALEVAEQAYKDVTKNLKGIAGNRRNEIRNVNSGGNHASVSAEPKSLRDVISKTLAG